MNWMNRWQTSWLLLTIGLVSPSLADKAYDPLIPLTAQEGPLLETSVRDRSRQREIPLRIYVPATAKAAPVVLFSHGLGGTRESCEYLGKHWAQRQYVAVFLQHPGSDESVWRDERLPRRMSAMQGAASMENFRLRNEDVAAVLDQLQQWNGEASHPLFSRLDLSRVGMSGHSFGAVTTQAVSGQAVPLLGQRFVDPRIDAAIALSPSTPRAGRPEQAFAQVKIPWMLMTGTKDTAPIGGQSVESRLAVYPNLPRTIDRYEIVLHDAEHSAFTDRKLPGERTPKNPNHHRVILGLSTAFWDAYLREDAAALAWLQGPAAKGIMQRKDRWQFAIGR